MQDLSTLEQRLERLGIQDHPKAKKLLSKATVTENQRIQKVAKQRLHIFIQQYQEYPFTEETPDTSYLDDPVILGETLQDREPYALKESDLTKHVLTIGATGAGKTTLHRNLMTQLNSPFWAFDRKQDYRHLIQEMDNLLVLPWKQLKLNPLKPPEGVDPDRWANIFSIIFSQCFGLLTGSEGFLTTAVIRLYTKYGLYKDCSAPYPSLFELTRLVKSDEIDVGPSSVNYKDRGYWRLHPQLLNAGKIFDCSEGYSVRELIQKNIVFEIGGRNRNLQRFIQQILFAKVYEYFLAHNQRDMGVQLAFIVDEAKQLFSVYLEMQDASGMPEIDDMAAKSRQLGLPIIAADQEATKLTESLKANTDTKVLLPVNDQKQLEAIAESMQLNQLQKRYIRNLDVGQAVIQHGSRKPLPVDLDDHTLPGHVDDEQLEARMDSQWENMEYTERKPGKLDFSKDSGSPDDSNLEKYL